MHGRQRAVSVIAMRMRSTFPSAQNRRPKNASRPFSKSSTGVDAQLSADDRDYFRRRKSAAQRAGQPMRGTPLPAPEVSGPTRRSTHARHSTSGAGTRAPRLPHCAVDPLHLTCVREIESIPTRCDSRNQGLRMQSPGLRKRIRMTVTARLRRLHGQRLLRTILTPAHPQPVLTSRDV